MRIPTIIGVLLVTLVGAGALVTLHSMLCEASQRRLLLCEDALARRRAVEEALNRTMKIPAITNNYRDAWGITIPVTLRQAAELTRFAAGSVVEEGGSNTTSTSQFVSLSIGDWPNSLTLTLKYDTVVDTLDTQITDLEKTITMNC